MNHILQDSDSFDSDNNDHVPETTNGLDRDTDNVPGTTFDSGETEKHSNLLRSY